jgi:apolipoprotein D and lipocalin family protein
MYNRIILLGLMALTFGACSKTTSKPGVQPFELNRYLGTWYEIARYDHRFERGLDSIQANYSLREDGKIRVLNRGYDTAKARWKQSEGKAKWRGDTTRAELEVSFFGPFYGEYTVLKLDPEYKVALIGSSSPKYLWILARDKVISPEVRADYLRTAQLLGYDTTALIWVRQ